MSEHHFETHRPVSLFVEIGKGSVTVRATETTETTVEISGRDADAVRVTQEGDQISVIAPKRHLGLFVGDDRLDVVVTLPSGSTVAARSGSADIAVEGEVGSVQVKSGSGSVDVEVVGGPAAIDTGSGDIRVQQARAELRIKSGSGDVTLGEAVAGLTVSTGSGDIEIGSTAGSTVLKTGSGDVVVTESLDDLSFMSGSGDLQLRRAHRGRLTAKGASSDVQLGIRAGIPVWTDISTVSGEIHSNLNGAGRPEEGADHVEVRAKTVSGDIVLVEV